MASVLSSLDQRGGFQQRPVLVHGLKMQTWLSTIDKNAPPIVIVHGLVGASRYMMPTANLLAPDYAVYVPDLPGYGDSDKPIYVLSVAELADMLGEWMNKLSLDRVAMLGFSFGTQIVAEFAARYPRRLSQVVLAAPTFDRHARSVSQQLWRFLQNVPLEDPGELPTQAYDYWTTGFPRIARSLEIGLSDRIEAKLPLMSMPTLVVRGSKDPVVPQQWAEEVVSLLPRGELTVIPGAGHTINYSAPLELSRIVRAFLASVRDRAQETVDL